jgi:hypothetical protein
MKGGLEELCGNSNLEARSRTLLRALLREFTKCDDDGGGEEDFFFLRRNTRASFLSSNFCQGREGRQN